MLNQSMPKVTRRGFSLAEVLITLAIIAILMAMLLPAVNSQLGKGDATRAANDLVAVQTGIQSFTADVHRLPQSISQLTTKITTSSNDLANPLAAPIPDYLVANWRGPYVNRDAAGANRIGNIQDAFSVTRVPAVGNPFVDYVTITMTLVSRQDFVEIEKILDEGTTDATSTTAGLVRYSGTTLTFLAVPIM